MKGKKISKKRQFGQGHVSEWDIGRQIVSLVFLQYYNIYTKDLRNVGGAEAALCHKEAPPLHPDTPNVKEASHFY